MNPDKEEIESIIHSEDTVFHYTTMSTAIEHILSKKSLRFSGSTKTNDPREYREWIFTGFGSNHVLSHGRPYRIDSKTYRRNQDINSVLNRIIKEDYKLACFCSSRLLKPQASRAPSNRTPQYGYDRMRMWSQYGEKHSGICIAFSKLSLQQELRNKMGEKAFIRAMNVKYKRDLFMIRRTN